MKTMKNLLFALLLSLSAISCGGGDSGGSNGSKLPGVIGDTDNTPLNPDSGSGERTGTSSTTGCADTKGALPGCPA